MSSPSFVSFLLDTGVALARFDAASYRARMVVEPATPTKERSRTGSDGSLGDATRVIVLNDDHNTFDGVAAALAHVIPGVSFARGLELANRIHNTGSAIVWSGHREPAELYWQQLGRAGLTMAPLE
jgi:ATP-dependent Clp protease adaptor protein ClpS